MAQSRPLRTKYCNKLFTGCSNVHCTFAHQPNELEGPESKAWIGVKFKKPAKDHSLPISPFVVHLDSDSDSDSDSDREQPSISLSKLDKMLMAYKKKYHTPSISVEELEDVMNDLLAKARHERIWQLRLALDDMTVHRGEEEMDWSPVSSPRRSRVSSRKRSVSPRKRSVSPRKRSA